MNSLVQLTTDAHGGFERWRGSQLAYLAGYAMWTYLTTPFLFAMDGVATEELQPWRENGEMWRRLKVTFPHCIATHNTVQMFYFGSDGLLRRHDYDAEVLGGSPAAHRTWTLPGVLGDSGPDQAQGARAKAGRNTSPRPVDRDN